ncbi:hypothetical protein [Alkaliphilus sp. B6464]|uniref:hypothetical protein n=1 Tax=Alkaliphilus sp. B6464 TaxID=2731219 RepID=UPI001BA9D04F|nr:hypothetical protein [Alkaliphilus sp. B6464]QUH21876.1 hypothetical protein HYG84_18235 [Alkaliphilus sp. B6464]
MKKLDIVEPIRQIGEEFNLKKCPKCKDGVLHLTIGHCRACDHQKSDIVSM